MKKLLCAILFLTLIFCVPPLAASSASDVSVWDGNTPNISGGYSFYGTGTAADPYKISSAADLAALAALVNSGRDFDGEHFILTTDIDLNLKNWTSIGYAPLKDYNYISLTGATPFCGSFDGGRHTIRNLANTYAGSFTAAAPGYTYGLFGYIKGAVLKNFAVLDAKIEGYGLLGIACGSAQSNTEADPTILENIFVTGEITSGFYNTGGLLGRGLGVNPEANKYASDGSVKTGMFVRSCYSNAAFTMDASKISPDTVNLFIGTILGCTASNMVTATVLNEDNGCVINAKNNSAYKINRSGYAGAVGVGEEVFNGLLDAFLSGGVYEAPETTAPETASPPVTTTPAVTATPPATTGLGTTAAEPGTTAPSVTTASPEFTETTPAPENPDETGKSAGKVVLIVIFSLTLAASAIFCFILRKKTARVICAALALLMLAGIIAAALADFKGADLPGTETSEKAGTGSETTDNLYDEDGYLLDKLPNLDYHDADISVLAWDGQAYEEFSVSGISGELISDALFLRNYEVEDRLGVVLKFTKTKGGSSDYEAYLSQVSADILSGSRQFDIYAAYSRTTASCAYQGYTRDLCELEYLDFDSPWWPSTLIDSSTINGRLYFCTGDLSISLFHNLSIVYFNKTLLGNAGITADSLYKSVFDGEWTLDRMIELSSNMYFDLDGDGKKSDSDQFGYMASNTQSQVLVWGSGIRAITVERGKMEPDPSWTGEKMNTFLSKLLGWSAGNALYLNKSGNAAFADNKLAFLSNVATYTMSTFNITGLDYGILPPPKYNTAQENYISVMGNTVTLYAISSGNGDDEADMCGAVLECMSSEGWRRLTPAIFETAMKYKYAPDDTVSKVYDVIRDSVYYDHGRIYSAVFNDLFTNTYNTYIKTDGSSGWMSATESVRPQLESLIASVNSVFGIN